MMTVSRVGFISAQYIIGHFGDDQLTRAKHSKQNIITTNNMTKT